MKMKKKYIEQGAGERKKCSGLFEQIPLALLALRKPEKPA